MMRAVFGPDPLDDPLVAAWDAIVLNDQNTTFEVDPADVALLRQISALDDPATLSSTFFQDLELRLAGISSAPVAPRWWTTSVVAPTVAAVPLPVDGHRRSLPSSTEPSQVHSRSIQWPGRRHSVQVALAVLAVLLVASFLVLYQAVPRSTEPPAIPAAPIAELTMEPMFKLDVTPALFGIPEASTWTHTYFNLIEIDPGSSFTTDTDWYTSIDGPLLFVVLSGELTIQPEGPARFYPDYQRDPNPTAVSPGHPISLGAGAAIVYSAVDSATGINPGSESVTALQLSIGRLAFSGPGTESSPLDIQVLDRQWDWEMDAPPTAGVTLSIQRLQLAPLDSFVFDPDLHATYFWVFDQFRMEDVRMANGAYDGFAPNVETDRLTSSTQLTYPDAGPHTIFNLGGETVELYVLTVEPLPGGGTPPA